jgi:hypothetical protein
VYLDTEILVTVPEDERVVVSDRLTDARGVAVNPEKK